MKTLGDFFPGDVIDLKFNSRSVAQAPITLAGGPAVAVYKDNQTVESTAGVTLAVDQDGRTGMHHVRITTASDGAFYSSGSNFQVVLSAGTVDGISVVGVELASFSLGRQVVGTRLPAGAVPAFGIVDNGVAQAVTATTLQLRAAAGFPDDTLIGATLMLTDGPNAGATAAVTDFVGATDTATIAGWSNGATPTGTPAYIVFGTAPVSGGGSGLDAAGVRAAIGLASANLDTQLTGVQTDTNDIQARLPAALVSGRMDASVGAMAANVMTAAAAAADLTTELQTGLATAAGLSAAVAPLATSAGVTTAVAPLATAAGVSSAVAPLATAAALTTVAGYLDTEIAAILAVAAKLDTMLELDGAVYRLTVNALEQAPLGGGGGGTDWTADERTVIRAVLGIPGAGTVAADPSTGILDTIRDSVATRASQTSVDDLPTNAELSTALAAADDATIAAVVSVAGEVTAVKAKTDQLTFTSGHVQSDLRRVVGGAPLVAGADGGQSYGEP